MIEDFETLLKRASGKIKQLPPMKFPEDIQGGVPYWAVRHIPTGKVVHMRLVDETGEVMLTLPTSFVWWFGQSEEQAIAQASFLGDDYEAVCILCSGDYV